MKNSAKRIALGLEAILGTKTAMSKQPSGRMPQGIKNHILSRLPAAQYIHLLCEHKELALSRKFELALNLFTRLQSALEFEPFNVEVYFAYERVMFVFNADIIDDALETYPYDFVEQYEITWWVDRNAKRFNKLYSKLEGKS